MGSAPILRDMSRARLVPVATVLAFGVLGCTGQAPNAGSPTTPTTTPETPSPTTASPATASPTSASPATPSPTRAPSGRSAGVTKLLVFIEENHSLSQMKAEMPYAFGLAERYGYATDFTAIQHPSLPNYIAVAGGSTHGITDDDGPADNPVPGRSVFGQAIAAGKTAGVYADGMPENCALEDGGSDYAVKHNPWAYFPDERGDCEKYDVPLDHLDEAIDAGTLPNVAMVIPNLCNDAHDCPLDTADSWLEDRMSSVLSGPDWKAGRLAVVVTGDEDDHSQGNRVLTVVVHPSQQGNVVTSPLTHYSLSGLFSDVTGTSRLGEALTAPSMADAFRLPLAASGTAR